MVIFIISLLPAALLFGVGLALHTWALFSEQKEEAAAEEINQKEIRERHRAQASSDMAELNVFAAYYGGVRNENSNE